VTGSVEDFGFVEVCAVEFGVCLDGLEFGEGCWFVVGWFGVCFFGFGFGGEGLGLGLNGGCEGCWGGGGGGGGEVWVG